MIQRIISGGQTGADQAGLFAARARGLATGGWAPRGWRTDAGPAPWLADYGLIEHESSAYPLRTRDNVLGADTTLVFGRPDSPGCTLTCSLAQRAQKRLILVPWPSCYTFEGEVDRVRALLRDTSTLNVAGNRERTNPGIQEACCLFLLEVLSATSP